ncbi:MAG: hypothetical protein DHS20C21_04350 [Gemmatimonadota bacterium]|nr:MAG: hypothetical protein DHS20C21_04350 [Gemmatimonadota bacterium]
MRRGILLLPTLAILLSACRNGGSAPDDLIVTQETTEAIVFVKTTAEETLNRSWAASNLYTLAPIAPDGVVKPLTNFTGASISDPCVSYDGERILFSMRQSGDPYRNIWEIGADGTGLRQVTSGDGHDFDPIYLPSGQILFTSSRGNEMDEYNHSPAEHMHVCNADGTGIERISFNQSDDFDPVVLPTGRIAYTRWDHFGTFNRFPLFATNPDGTGTFHSFGPHGRNFFHAYPMSDGRLIAIESTMVNEDAGPIAVLKTEAGPADPAPADGTHWDVLTANVNNNGAPWAYGAFKYPHPLGERNFVASYTLPAADDAEVDYGLYTFSLRQDGAGSPEDPATLSIIDLTFLYNDPLTNEYDAQLIAPRSIPPVIERTVDLRASSGTFLAQDVFNRTGAADGQEMPRRGIDTIDRIAVIAARPTRPGERNEFSANDFEKRALIGFAPVQPDGSVMFDVPADTPISFATLDEHDRGFVVKRTHLYVRPGEKFLKCVGCHEGRTSGEPLATNLAPMAAELPATDLNLPESQWRIINYETDIAPIVEAKCADCHIERITTRNEVAMDDQGVPFTIAVTETIPAPGDLPLTSELIEGGEMMAEFPRAYVNLSGEPEERAANVVRPAFPRRSLLVDAILGLGAHESTGAHPDPAGPYALTDEEKETINFWVLLGAQYK